jgi:hypothetical protein
LAEALRPAVAMLHEAVSSDEAEQLPEYQGSLPWQRRPSRRRAPVARLAGPQKAKAPPQNYVPTLKRGERRQPQMLSAIRLIAASLILAALGLIFGNNLLAPAKFQRGAQHPLAAAPAVNPLPATVGGAPTAQGLLTLASLKLPNSCVPFSHRPISLDEAAQIVDAISDGSLNGLRCCTECHRSGSPRSAASRLVASLQQSCQACHRG